MIPVTWANQLQETLILRLGQIAYVCLVASPLIGMSNNSTLCIDHISPLNCYRLLGIACPFSKSIRPLAHCSNGSTRVSGCSWFEGLSSHTWSSLLFPFLLSHLFGLLWYFVNLPADGTIMTGLSIAVANWPILHSACSTKNLPSFLATKATSFVPVSWAWDTCLCRSSWTTME